MADEVTDPIEALAAAHIKRMAEIATEGFEKSKEICGDMVTRLKKARGLHDAVLDAKLTSLGITPEKP